MCMPPARKTRRRSSQANLTEVLVKSVLDSTRRLEERFDKVDERLDRIDDDVTVLQGEMSLIRKWKTRLSTYIVPIVLTLGANYASPDIQEKVQMFMRDEEGDSETHND